MGTGSGRVCLIDEFEDLFLGESVDGGWVKFHRGRDSSLDAVDRRRKLNYNSISIVVAGGR